MVVVVDVDSCANLTFMLADDGKPAPTMKNEAEKKFNIDREQIKRSVNALWQYVQKSQGLNASSLLDFAEQVSMQLGFHKVPSLRGNKTVKIRLEHSLLQENQDVCLFVKDLDKTNRDYSNTVDHFKELLEKHGVTYVTQVIPVKSLKTEYKPFEAKRNLSDMYEFFLADERIGAMLPQQLGKHFLKKKRHPIPVNLKAKDLKKELDRAMHTSLCVITGRGSACQVKVAHTGLSIDAAVENIIKAAETLASSVPGGPVNVKTLHIRTFDSPAIPVYVSKENSNDVKVARNSEPPALGDPEDLTTLTGAKVLVRHAGQVDVIPDGQEVFLRRPRKRQRKQVEESSDGQPPAKVATRKGNKRQAMSSASKESAGNPFGRIAKKKRESRKLNSQKSKGGQKRKPAFKGKPPKFNKMK